jgi:hypothetical protein
MHDLRQDAYQPVPEGPFRFGKLFVLGKQRLMLIGATNRTLHLWRRYREIRERWR